jgi:hypothetical protein
LWNIGGRLLHSRYLLLNKRLRLFWRRAFWHLETGNPAIGHFKAGDRH